MQENCSIKPFVKWAGGKRQIFEEISSRVPAYSGRYFEPFVGGGAVFLGMQPKTLTINDMNSDLIAAYRSIRDDVDSLIEKLKVLKEEHCKERYYEVRAMDRSPDFCNVDDVTRASRFIYLNRTCFNGLFRVNKDGFNNVPMGVYKNPQICDEKTLRAVHEYLCSADINILNGDFSDAVSDAKEGDFVYFDPPYDVFSTSDNGNFTGYQKGGFDRSEQTRLRDLCVDLDKRGVKFLLSNAATDFIKEIYSEAGFTIEIIQAKRAINSDGAGRGAVDEVLVSNYR